MATESSNDRVLRERRALLNAVLAGRGWSESPLASSAHSIEEVRSVLVDELLERGLDERGEVSEYGRRIDDLIGSLPRVVMADDAPDRMGNSFPYDA
jgi:hypothetical protein